MRVTFIHKAALVMAAALAVCWIAEAAPATPSTDADSVKYDPQSTAMLLNYCRESLYKIIEFNDRTVLDDEYGKLVNNIDITRIQDDEAAELIEVLLTELNALKLNDQEKQFLSDAYNRQIQGCVMEALRGAAVPMKSKNLVRSVGRPAAMACQAIVGIAAGVTSYRSAIARQKHAYSERMRQLQVEELNRLTVLRTRFFDTEYKLYKRYSLPDRLNLKEVQMAQYIKVLADEDAQRRLERLERLQGDFDAFPPFWYQIGKAAQDAGKPDLAKSSYAHFERIHCHIFREDLDYVMLCMHRVLISDIDRDRDAIRRDLRIIEDNTKYYYQWENMLFAALMYYQLGDLENARRLIRTSINEGYCVPMHESILTQMESDAAKSSLRDTANDLVAKADADALDALGKAGPGQRLEALRALGDAITGIRLAMEKRSHAAQNASYLIPGYNLYAAGRAIQKGDAYYDNVMATFPDTWFAADKTKVKLTVQGRSFKPGDRTHDKKTATTQLTFGRVMKQDEIVLKKQERRLTLRLENKTTTLDLDFLARPVTPQLQKLRPELTTDEVYFELQAVRHEGRTYKVEGGLITYGK